ncbi:hypothetical protein TWF281_011333 [Arthrobotrys megalospora]
MAARTIPAETLLGIFDHLSKKDLFLARQVCSRWRVVGTPALYRQLSFHAREGNSYYPVVEDVPKNAHHVKGLSLNIYDSNTSPSQYISETIQTLQLFSNVRTFVYNDKDYANSLKWCILWKVLGQAITSMPHLASLHIYHYIPSGTWQNPNPLDDSPDSPVLRQRPPNLQDITVELRIDRFEPSHCIAAFFERLFAAVEGAEYLVSQVWLFWYSTNGGNPRGPSPRNWDPNAWKLQNLQALGLFDSPHLLLTTIVSADFSKLKTLHIHARNFAPLITYFSRETTAAAGFRNLEMISIDATGAVIYLTFTHLKNSLIEQYLPDVLKYFPSIKELEIMTPCEIFTIPISRGNDGVLVAGEPYDSSAFVQDEPGDDDMEKFPHPG